MNDEATTCRKTKYKNLGQEEARIMTNEDLEAARSKHAEQEITKGAQEKRK